MTDKRVSDEELAEFLKEEQESGKEWSPDLTADEWLDFALDLRDCRAEKERLWLAYEYLREHIGSLTTAGTIQEAERIRKGEKDV